VQWQIINNYFGKLILKKQQAHIWFFDLDKAGNEKNLFRSMLSQDELTRADKFHFEIDRNRFICTRGVLRCLIHIQTGIKPSLIKFSYSSNAKPELEKEQNQTLLKFNISHSENALCIGMVNNVSIGIDIEFLKPIPDLHDLAKNYFSEAEFQKIAQLPEKYMLEGFYNCWTRKEAVIKAVGEGLSFPLKDFDVSLMPVEESKIINVRGKAREQLKDLFLETFKIDNDIVGAAAIRGKVEKIFYLRVDQYDDLVCRLINTH